MGWVAVRFRGKAGETFARILTSMETAMNRLNESPYATHDDTRLCVAISRESLHVLRRAARDGAWCAAEMDGRQRSRAPLPNPKGAEYNADYGAHKLIANGVAIDRKMRMEMVVLRFMDHCLPLPTTAHQVGAHLFTAANAGCAALDRLADALAAAAADVRVRYALEAAEKAPDRKHFFRELVARKGVEGRMFCAIHHQGRSALESLPTIVRYARGFPDDQRRRESLRLLSAILARILEHGDMPLWNDAERTMADVFGPIAQAVSIEEGKP
ncbi:MAG: hypothetical protein ACYCSN_10210 [Acidobacteriaceae bacterium]